MTRKNWNLIQKVDLYNYKTIIVPTEKHTYMTKFIHFIMSLVLSVMIHLG